MPIAPAAVAKSKHPVDIMVHRCLGHPCKGPLYYLLNAVGTLPAKLHPALKTHLREHLGDLALLAPNSRATDCPPPPPPQGPSP